MRTMISYETIAEYYNIVLFMFAVLTLSALILLLYHGAFHRIEVKSARPPFDKDLIVVYKFTPNYAQSRHLLAEAQSIAPELNSFSIYHENFYQKRNQVGSSVGVVLEENMQESVCAQLVSAGFHPAVLPAVDFAVVASFPNRSRCSLALAIHRIYPALRRYIKANRLCAHPILELYTKETLFFMAPLSKQFDFYAEEAIVDPLDEESSSEEREEEKCRLKRSGCIRRKAPKTCDPLLEDISCERIRRAI